MTRVELTELARQNLDSLIRTRELPPNVYDRLRRSLEPLESFPLAGRALRGRHDGLRIIVGPWRWVAVLYEYWEEEDVILVVGILGARTLGAPGQ